MSKKKSEATNTIRIGLSEEDVRFVERQKLAIMATHKEVFRCLKIIVELNKDGDFMTEDEKAVLVDLAAKWTRLHPWPVMKSLKECQVDVVDGLVNKIEDMLFEYEPLCQMKVLAILKRTLPIEG